MFTKDGIEAAIESARRKRALGHPDVRRHLRIGADVSLSDIAREMGVSVAAVSRWEKGTRTPRGLNLERYTAILERLQTEITR